MGFDRGKIRLKATNISIMDRKGGKSIMGCRVISGAITTTASVHSHLGGRVRNYTNLNICSSDFLPFIYQGIHYEPSQRMLHLYLRKTVPKFV